MLDDRRGPWGDLSKSFKPARNSRRSNWFYLAIVLALIVVRLLYTSSFLPDTTPSASQTQSARYAVVTYESRPVSYWRESLGNKVRYARRHGYDIIPTLERDQLKNDGTSMVWAKIPVILDALDSRPYEWVLFMDFDTLFTNLSITIESFLEETKETCLSPDQKWEDVSMIAAPDCQNFNAGVLMFRNTEWTRQFMDLVWEQRRTPRLSEQDAMRATLESLDEFETPTHLVRVPQYKFNSYPEELSCHEDRHKLWEPGYWIIHFAGAWTYFRDHEDPFGAMLQRYYPRVVE